MRYVMKTITVEPGSSTGFHRHNHKLEYWIVVSGACKLKQRAFTMQGETVAGDRIISEGGTAKIEPKHWHQIDNYGKDVLVLAAIWLGDNVSEDDIEKFISTQKGSTSPLVGSGQRP